MLIGQYPSNYSEVVKLTTIISDRRMETIEIIDIISLLEDKEQSFEKLKADTSRVLVLISQVKESFRDSKDFQYLHTHTNKKSPNELTMRL